MFCCVGMHAELCTRKIADFGSDLALQEAPCGHRVAITTSKAKINGMKNGFSRLELADTCVSVSIAGIKRAGYLQRQILRDEFGNKFAPDRCRLFFFRSRIAGQLRRIAFMCGTHTAVPWQCCCRCRCGRRVIVLVVCLRPVPTVFSG